MSDEEENPQGMTDTDLVMLAQRGNMEAFEQLIQRHDKRVLTIAAGYVNSSDDAKDIYQEVFLRVYKGLPKFHRRSEFSTWLFRITTNVCLSFRSRRKSHTHISLDDHRDGENGRSNSTHAALMDTTSADQRTHNGEISHRIEDALQRLSPRQRMVFTLKHYDGYKLREIADMMKCNEGTVKKYLFEATARLRKQLKDFAG